MRLIDCHSHVNFTAYREDAEAVILRATERGIGMLAVGSQYATSAAAVEAAERHDGVWSVIGLHPAHIFSTHIDTDEGATAEERTFDPAKYRALAARSKKIVGIGECGLDYYRLPEDADVADIKRRQKEAFRLQLDLARELDLAVMIHCREAHGDVAEILKEYAAAGKPLRGDIHCFTGTLTEAERYLALGFFISFTGIITFPPRKDEIARGETLQDVVRAVPIERMLVETDAPYLAPVPFRGKRNEPAYVEQVAAKVAELKGMAVADVERQTTKNAVNLFRLD